MLGHASPAITLSIYAHEFARAEHADRTRERMKQAFGELLRWCAFPSTRLGTLSGNATTAGREISPAVPRVEWRAMTAPPQAILREVKRRVLDRLGAQVLEEFGAPLQAVCVTARGLFPSLCLSAQTTIMGPGRGVEELKHRFGAPQSEDIRLLSCRCG
jgi:hypothetical protein